MEDNDKQFIKGFNNGYTIAQHQSDLFKNLKRGLKTLNDYTSGFILGGMEHEKEKKIARLQELRKNMLKHPFNKRKEMDRDR